METARITAKGQVTIPKKVRARMAVEAGDRLAFELDDDGGVRIVPLRHPPKPLRGFLAAYASGRKADDESIRRALRGRAAKKHGRP
jgi:AbrB family looped-hinge helix DNA binding protein